MRRPCSEAVSNACSVPEQGEFLPVVAPAIPAVIWLGF